MKKERLVICLGILCLAYWIIDFINIVYGIHRISWLLWYSSAGLLFSAVALISRKDYLLYSAFCALFLIEAVWTLDFLQTVLFHTSWFHFTQYAFQPHFGRKDFIMTLYHIVVPFSLFVGLFNTKHIFRYGWVGATVFLGILLSLSYLLTGPSDLVNCVHGNCKTAFSFLFIIPNPYRLFVAFLLIVVFVYLPTNYIVLWFKQKQHIKSL